MTTYIILIQLLQFSFLLVHELFLNYFVASDFCYLVCSTEIYFLYTYTYMFFLDMLFLYLIILLHILKTDVTYMDFKSNLSIYIASLLSKIVDL